MRVARLVVFIVISTGCGGSPVATPGLSPTPRATATAPPLAPTAPPTSVATVEALSTPVATPSPAVTPTQQVTPAPSPAATPVGLAALVRQLSTAAQQQGGRWPTASAREATASIDAAFIADPDAATRLNSHTGQSEQDVINELWQGCLHDTDHLIREDHCLRAAGQIYYKGYLANNNMQFVDALTKVIDWTQNNLGQDSGYVLGNLPSYIPF